MKEKPRKQQYESVSIQSAVAVKFRQYSRAMSKTQSATLLMMLEFFEDNGVSPNESLGPKIQTLEYLIKKRVNGLVSIIKNIEKTQTKPILAMMQLLFEEAPWPKQELWLERKPEHGNDTSQDTKLQTIKLRMEALELKKELTAHKDSIKIVIENVVIVRNNFGKPYFKLNLTEEQLESIKKSIQ
ncbi:BfmA/BtgA family mobilization protein [Arenibacter sp. GZD96]|uniref:BfmA/BtgA family mobilization protein n=1 Tax=Aurantibrevibacter litoralis TaxID=3106030 RepID=UPI002AFDDE4F|nr:BfmA/BtgA family mobilization protein [Arenibacter sp. GZD-96]MEA1785442.1 BfmA/BtgA family mobilization protein [Arenibacter sp. GZD-96]